MRARIGAHRGAAILRNDRPRTAGEIISWGAIETSLGRVHAAAGAKGLVAVSLPGDSETRFLARLRDAVPAAEVRHAAELRRATEPALDAALAQLEEYFEGRRRRFDLRIDLRCTPFERRVLEELARVPFGETATYGELAARVGDPGAARAVGRALSRNPIPLVLPCHRITAKGSLGGFAGKECAVDVKRSLLAFEGVAR